MSDNIYKRTASYVTGLFEKNPHPNLQFHNLDHTKKVVERTQEIAAHYQLNEADTLIIYIAAWFHDTGHLFTEIEKHEKKSVELMTSFASNEKEITDESIEKIASCILATKLPHDPKNLLEEIICDADTYHFGTKEFKTTNKLVKKEFQLRGYPILLNDWTKNTIELLESHTFFTTYCKVLLDQKKKKNIEWLKRKDRETSADNIHHNLFESGSDNKQNSKQKGNLLIKGLQTIMRVTSANHLRLSEMADRKANILISVNAIIISVILSLLGEKLADDPYLTIPVILFLISSLSTIIVAILSTLPKVTEGVFTRDDILSKRTNLLFFGNFYKSSLEEYQWAMATLMKDTEYVYTVLVKDIHQIGVVLGRKYKLVRLAYNIFMVGLIVTVAAFFVAIIVNYGHTAERSTITSGSGSPL
ncbi:MAG: metal-dependent phosphohydrolase sub domain protein [Chitinophagaceae bacterium]|nr:metal-dependent phosphohydrolase sub domain protein [Chitinophagaceae bacterium]